MQQATKNISILMFLAVVLCCAAPAGASCNFSLPMLQGGVVGTPPGSIINAGATHVNGFFWELGFGNPEDGVGNDGNSVISGYPAFSTEDPLQRWIKGAPDHPRVDWDWFNFGVDNCLSGGAAAIADTVMVTYILDSNDHYAIAALKATPPPLQWYNLDLLVTGFGPNGNDVVMGPRIVKPQLTNVVAADEQCLAADVLPATAGLNLYFDAGGPYDGIVSVESLVLDNGGTVETCDPRTGCHLDCVRRNSDLCWSGDVDVIAQQPGSSFPVCNLLDTPCSSDADCSLGACQLFPQLACDPQNPADCFDGAAGPCLPDHCVFPSDTLIPFGPPIEGACLHIEGPPSTAADPEGQGYWNRQCLGVPVRDGGLDPGRRGRGPSEPLEPDFVSVLMPAVDQILETTLFEDRGTCYGGMHAAPASDLCEKAIKQYTALILNVESGRLLGHHAVDLSAEGCTSADVASLVAELAGLINSADPDNCRLAIDCADPVNEGDAIMETLTVASSGEGQDQTVTGSADADVGLMREGGRRAIRRHLSVLANASAPQSARDVSTDALLTALSGGYGLEVRLRIAGRLLVQLDVAYESLLADHLRDIRREAAESGARQLASRADALLESLQPKED